MTGSPLWVSGIIRLMVTLHVSLSTIGYYPSREDAALAYNLAAIVVLHQFINATTVIFYYPSALKTLARSRWWIKTF